MEKKVLEMYVSPALEVVELELRSALLDASTGGSTDPNTDVEPIDIPEED